MAANRIFLDGEDVWNTGADIWYDTVSGQFYSESSLTNRITKVQIPTRKCYRFTGYYHPRDESIQYVDADGNILQAFYDLQPRFGAIILARGEKVSWKLTLDDGNGSGGDGAIYYKIDGGGWYADDLCAGSVIGYVTPPTYAAHIFWGYYSNGTPRTGSNGRIDYTISEDTTWTAAYSSPWTITVSANSGTGGTATFYFNPLANKFFLTQDMTEEASSIIPHTRTGYTLLGCYAENNTTSAQRVAADGTIAADWTPTEASTTIYARWSVNSYTLTFDYNGGTGSTASKTVTFGSAIGTLPSATSPKGDFVEWQVNGTQITSTTVWNIDADASAVAKWNYIFGRVVDYFNLGNANLVPISSSSGDGKRRTCTANANWSSGSQNGGAGRYSSGVNDIGGIWRNPSVTYKVVGDCTVSLNLGQAFAATKSGSTMTISGWMIVSVRVQTSVGAFPTVTVSAVANEGANAINLFAVSIPVKARARAQNLLDAVSGGGNLLTSDMEAACTPVVCAEDNMPCASDVVQGKYTVRATTYAPNNEAAPAAAGGFVSIGEPKFCGDKEYMMWEMMAEKEIT